MSAPLLEVSQLCRWYPAGRAGISGPRQYVRAVTDVDLSVAQGETLAIIGESGCGKSTLGRTLLGLEPVRSGAVRFRGETITGRRDRALRSFRQEAQMVWQNATSAVNRRRRVADTIAEPLHAHRLGSRASRAERVVELIELVNLRPEVAGRFPHELSGGQLQRVVIARALALAPKLLVCDEPTAALDVSVRAQIVNLLVDLQERLDLTMVYISHDIRTVRVIADRVVIMYLGRIIEETTVDRLNADDVRHPYSQALLSAVPEADPRNRRDRPPPPGEVPSALSPPPGCSYHPRCPQRRAICTQTRPSLESGPDRTAVACHAVSGSGHAEWASQSPLAAEL
jgi:oligopeptide/dipeptide ABC transporter ATP-binding protein